jgi:hypothetical protein
VAFDPRTTGPDRLARLITHGGFAIDSRLICRAL